jgi:hypothetical protein
MGQAKAIPGSFRRHSRLAECGLSTMLLPNDWRDAPVREAMGRPDGWYGEVEAGCHG